MLLNKKIKVAINIITFIVIKNSTCQKMLELFASKFYNEIINTGNVSIFTQMKL